MKTKESYLDRVMLIVDQLNEHHRYPRYWISTYKRHHGLSAWVVRKGGKREEMCLSAYLTAEHLYIWCNAWAIATYNSDLLYHGAPWVDGEL